jgi:DNA (cytosine-5)-methyltransferase 1
MDRGLALAGFRHTLLAELDPWRRRVLAAHFAGVPILADVRLVTRDAAEPPDLICGGFPCQDLSVAGRRAGLAGARSGLFHEFARIVDAVRPRWILLENVPGLLSSNDGRDMGTVVGTLADLGYGVGWRVLDARYFGVPQRRRRVFLVGRLGGDGGSAIRPLCESCGGDPAPIRCSWQEPSGRARGGPSSDDWGDRYYVEDHVNGTLRANGTDGFPRIDRQPLVVRTDDTSPTLMAKAQRNEPTEESFVIYDVEQVANTMLGHRGKDGGGISPDETLVPFSIVPESGQGADLRATQVDTSPALGAVTHGRATDRGVRLADGVRVRRLTPTECERLMGWPDGWTAPDGVRAPDSKRYAACGDGVVANVAEWIGRRILREQLA